MATVNLPPLTLHLSRNGNAGKQGKHFRMNAPGEHKGHFATIGDLKMYYEIHGNGSPLVLLHGGGLGIESTFGRVLPLLARSFQVIAVELQAHGHTEDIDRPLSFEQDADDVAALLRQLQITKAHILGFSNGGTTALQIAIRHPKLVSRLVLASAIFRRDGMQDGFFEEMHRATLDDMPQLLKDAFLKANPDPNALQTMFDRDVARMLSFKDIPESNISSVGMPALIINGDAEVVRTEHALALSRTLPNGRLAILPGGHGEYIGMIGSKNDISILPHLVVEMIREFLKD